MTVLHHVQSSGSYNEEQDKGQANAYQCAVNVGAILAQILSM